MTFTDFENILKEKFPFVSGEQTERFRALEGLYREWNARINVISRKDIDQLYLHHVLHSLGIAGYLDEMQPDIFGLMRGEGSRRMKILDLGTGGGFPGIPLAILFPEADFTLCDSIGKKIAVASGVADALGLDNVRTVNARAESLTEKYDFVVSRAVTSLDKFLPWVKGKYSGGILYLKGGDLAEEISVAMEKNRLPKGSVHIWKLSSWTDDEYFDGKLVILIENNLQLK